jgi:hypothetical protein
MSFSCECCVFSGRGLYNEPIPRPEDLYRLCVFVYICDGLLPVATITLYYYKGEVERDQNKQYGQ